MSLATATLYEADFYGWTQRQADRLRARDMANLDVENLIEEIESMGRSEKRELTSRLELLLMHLLKWQYQPNFRSKSWQLTVKEQRRRVAEHLGENPSLKGMLTEVYEKAYGFAVLEAEHETGLDESIFPTRCPWTFEQAMDEGFWPETATIVANGSS